MASYTFVCNDCGMLQEFILSFKEYSDYREKKIDILCDNCDSPDLVRDYQEDLVYFSVHPTLSECKTLQQYAEKQSKIYGKEKCAKIAEGFKTKKTGGMEELPEGMTRINKAEDFKTYKSKRGKRPNGRK